MNIFRTPITEYEAIIGATDEDSQQRLRKNVILLHTRMEIYSANNNKKNLDIEKLEMKISNHYKLESANNSEKRHQEVEELFDFLNLRVNSNSVK